MLEKINYKIIIYCIFQNIFSNLQFCHRIRHQFEHNKTRDNVYKFVNENRCSCFWTYFGFLSFGRSVRSISWLDYRYCTITRTGTKAIYTTFNYGIFSRLFFYFLLLFQTRARPTKTIIFVLVSNIRFRNLVLCLGPLSGKSLTNIMKSNERMKTKNQINNINKFMKSIWTWSVVSANT